MLRTRDAGSLTGTLFGGQLCLFHDMSALTFSYIRRASWRDFMQFLAALISVVRRLFAKRRSSGPDGQNPGLCYSGKPVPIGPTPRHHLVAAKEFPPSDKTQSFRKD